MFWKKDGSLDELVLIGLPGVAAYLFFCGYDLIVLQHAFSSSSFGIGFGSVIGSLGLGIGGRNLMNGRVDPDVRPQP